MNLNAIQKAKLLQLYPDLLPFMEQLETKNSVKEIAQLIQDKDLKDKESISALDNKIEAIKVSLEESVSKIEENLKKKLEQELVLEINKEELKGDKGDDGDDYVLTKDDKKEIASLIKVPVVEKVIEKTETIKEVLPESIPVEIVKGALTRKDLDDQDKKVLDGMAVVDGRIKAIDQRWRGGGLSKVSHDTTLTGSGTSSDPLKVAGGGGSYVNIDQTTPQTLVGTFTFPQIKDTGLTASTILSADTNKQLTSLATSTYPSLTELSYVKGVTSAIQTQLNGKYSTSNPSGYITSSSLSPYWKKDGSSAPATGDWSLGNNIFYVGAQTGGAFPYTDYPNSTSFTTTYKLISPYSISGQEQDNSGNINDQYGDGNIYDIYNNLLGYLDYTTGVYTPASGDIINIISYTYNTPINNPIKLDYNSGGKAFFGSGSGDTYYNENNGASITLNGQGKQGWINIATNDGTNGSSAGIGYDDGKFKFGNNDWVGFNASVQGAGTRYYQIYANYGLSNYLMLSEDYFTVQMATTDIRGVIYDTTNGTGAGTSGYVLTSNGGGWSWQPAGGGGGWVGTAGSNLDMVGYSIVDSTGSNANSLRIDDGGGSAVLYGSTQAELVSGSNYVTASNTQVGFVVSGVAQMSAGNSLWGYYDGMAFNTEGGGSKMIALNPYNGPNGGGDGVTFFSMNLAPANVVRIDGYGMMLTPMSQPSSPNEGQMYVDNSSGNHLYIYLNSTWNLII